MKWLSVAVLLLFALSVTAQDVNKNTNKGEPPILGPHWTHDVARAQPPATSPDMIYHGGPILPSVTVKAIWWGSSWPTYTGDEISGLDKWYSNVGTTAGGAGSAYDATVNEYTDSTGQQVTTATTYQGHVVDRSSVPKRLSTSAVLAEVCKMVPSPTVGAYYPVYIDKGRGHASYCAYHSWGSCGSTPVEFGFFLSSMVTPGATRKVR